MPTQALHYIADKGLSIASAYPYASEDIPVIQAVTLDRIAESQN